MSNQSKNNRPREPEGSSFLSPAGRYAGNENVDKQTPFISDSGGTFVEIRGQLDESRIVIAYNI